MRAFIFRLAVACFLAPVLAAAQMPAQAPTQRTAPAAAGPRPAKRDGWLRRPAADTPAAQFRHAEALREGGRLARAARAYDALVRRWPESPEAPEAQWALAAIQELRGRLFQAFAEYQYLVDRYAGAFNYEEALKRQTLIARRVMSERRLTLGVFRGFEAPERALPLLATIVSNAPAWPQAAEAQFDIGRIYENQGDLDDAVDAYEKVQVAYPESVFAPRAMFRAAACLHRLFERRLHDENAGESARVALRVYLDSHSAGADSEEARALLRSVEDRLAGLAWKQARYYDVTARNPRAALITYEDFLRRFPNAPQVERTRQRIRELRAQGNSDER